MFDSTLERCSQYSVEPPLAKRGRRGDKRWNVPGEGFVRNGPYFVVKLANPDMQCVNTVLMDTTTITERSAVPKFRLQLYSINGNDDNNKESFTVQLPQTQQQ